MHACRDVCFVYVYSCNLVVLNVSVTNNYHINIIVGVRFIYQHIKDKESLIPMLLHLVQNKERLNQIQVRRSKQGLNMRVIFCVEPYMYVHVTHNTCIHYVPICASMKEFTCIYLHVLQTLPYICKIPFHFYI